MNKLVFSMLFLAVFGLISCSEEPVAPVDFTTPTISNLESATQIEPYPGQTIPWDRSGINFYFSVADPEGVSEVNLEVIGQFSRQSESTFNNNFELLNHVQIFSNETNNEPIYNFPFGADTLNFNPVSINWEGTFSVTNLPVLAGPYDIIISAQDISGNKTSSQDGTDYHTTIFVERRYAPLIHRPYGLPEVVSANSDDFLALDGGIMQTEDVISTPMKFIWIKLSDKDVLGDFKGDTDQVVFEERIWGQSLRLEKSGDELPSDSSITFNELLEIEPINFPEGKSNLVLIVWAEDEAGNVSRRVIPIEVK